MNRIDNLSPKLLCDIIGLAATTQPFSYKIHLSSYAAVSRKWQRLVEPKQFNSIRITNDDIDTFASVFGNDTTGEHRKASLQQLFLRVYSSYRSIKPRTESTIEERRNEVVANDTVFTKSLQSLFGALQSWSLEHSLVLYLFVPTKDSDGVFACRTEPHILDLESLPLVSCIEKFVSTSQMCLPTETLVGIASRLPNLRHVEWQIADGVGLIQRRQNRSDFANQLLALKTLCPSLTTLGFVFRSPFPSRNPIAEVPSVLLPYASIDYLCVSLRKLCQSMQRVVLTNLPISSQLFWPLGNGYEAGEDDEPFWPKLTHFDLEFSICAAEGGLWTDFLTLPSCSCRAGPTNIPTPDEKQQPERPAHTTEVPPPPWPSEELEDLLLVIAKAIARMPLLQVFSARVGKSSWRETLDLEDHGFGMRYSSPAEGETGINGAILAKRLEWTAPSEWRMSTTLEEQWRSILGDIGVVEYLV